MTESSWLSLPTHVTYGQFLRLTLGNREFGNDEEALNLKNTIKSLLAFYTSGGHLMLPLLMIIPVVASLSVVVTLTELWVTKDVRFLHRDLQFHDHNLTLVGSLYQDQLAPVDNIDDGGDFDHLLPVHQKYYASVKAVNLAQLRRGPRGFVTPQVALLMDEYDKHMGEDALEPAAYYVNDSPARGLQEMVSKLGLDAIDVVVVLSPEGKEAVADTLVEVCESEGVLVVLVKLPPSQHIYYQDENYFRIQEAHGHNLRRNAMGGRIRMTNREILWYLNHQEFGNDTTPRELDLRERVRFARPLGPKSPWRHHRINQSQQVIAP